MPSRRVTPSRLATPAGTLPTPKSTHPPGCASTICKGGFGIVAGTWMITPPGPALDRQLSLKWLAPTRRS